MNTPLYRLLKGVVHSAAGQRVVTANLGWHYRLAGVQRIRPLSELQHRLATFDRSDRAQRQPSVDALVELFFDIADNAEIERFIEAGAKDAGASIRAMSSWPSVETVAFEANPYTHRRFAAVCADAGVRYEHLALDEHPGQVTFLVRLNDNGVPIADGQGSLLHRPDYTLGYEAVTVDAVTLDGYLGEQRRTAMWVDVEGASSNVLLGATDTLAVTDVVMIEVEERAKWTGQQWMRREVVEFFDSCDLVPIARDRQSRQQFNIVFVRRDLADRPGVAEALSRFKSRYRIA